MYTYMYICVYAPSICIYVCVYMHTCMYVCVWTSLVAQMLKSLSTCMCACLESWGRSSLSTCGKYLTPTGSRPGTQRATAVASFCYLTEKAMAPHSSTLAWKIPWMEEPGRLQSMGLQRVGHDWVTSLLLFTFLHWRRKWQPSPVFLPGESQGQQSLVGCRLWGHTESGTTEVT